MGGEIEADYLVVGAGAAGMAFVDEILAHTDATAVLVDRRHAPGGHWIDAYPFVQLHQPSAFYGVSSTRLGRDQVSQTGTNRGFYELAGADEIRAYYDRVLRRRFLASGRVRFFPQSEYLGGHRFVSRLTGDSTEVRVKRKLVDARYVEGTIPATSPPPFPVARGARCIPAGELARLREPAERFVIVGAGKTALDVCVWLLERGVAGAAIRWIKPREAWWMNRRFHQPHDLFPAYYAGVALQLEAMARASSVDDLFRRLESRQFFLRVEPGVWPTMCRGAVISERELELLRQVEDVVRLGRVQRIERDQIVLDRGTVPTSRDTVHVHCAARGLVRRPLRPIFEPDRVTLQPFMWGFACYQFAALAVIEATVDTDDARNRLVPPIPSWNVNADYLSAFLATLTFEQARRAYPALSSWATSTRLSPVAGIAAHRDDPRVVDARQRIKGAGARAVANLQALLEDR